MMVVWRITRKIIGTVLCMTVVRNDMHTLTHEQFLKMSAGLGLVLVHLFTFSILCVFLV